MSTYETLRKLNAWLVGRADALATLPDSPYINIMPSAADIAFRAKTLDEGLAIVAALPDAKWENFGPYVRAYFGDVLSITLWTIDADGGEPTYTADDLTAEAVTA